MAHYNLCNFNNHVIPYFICYFQQQFNDVSIYGVIFACCVLWQVLDGITDAPNIRNPHRVIRIRLSTAACW